MSKGPFEYSGVATGSGGVDSVFGRTGDVVAEDGDYTASQVTNVPAGNIAATDVQAAINELDTEKAPSFTVGVSLSLAAAVLTRAALTGDVTAAANSNATTIANSAVTNAKMANMAATTVKANPTGGSAAPQDVTLDGTLEFNSTTLRRAAITGPVAIAAGSNTSTMTANSTALASLANAAAQFDIIGRKTTSGGAWEDCTRSQLELAVTNSSGNTLLGSQIINLAGATPITPPSGPLPLQCIGSSGTQRIVFDSLAGFSAPVFRRFNTSYASPTAVQANDIIGTYSWQGYGTSQIPGNSAVVSVTATENFTNTAAGARMELSVTPNGAAAQVSRLTVFNDGGIGLSAATSIGAGTLNAPGAIRAGQFTFATLPAAATVGAGARAYITDHAAVPVYAANAAGGGSVGLTVTSNGSNWINM